MSDPFLTQLHLLAARHRLGFGRAEMALVLGLSPAEVAAAEGDVPNDPARLTRPLEGRTEVRLRAFLTGHPLGIGLLEPVRMNDCSTATAPTAEVAPPFCSEERRGESAPERKDQRRKTVEQESVASGRAGHMTFQGMPA